MGYAQVKDGTFNVIAERAPVHGSIFMFRHGMSDKLFSFYVIYSTKFLPKIFPHKSKLNFQKILSPVFPHKIVYSKKVKKEYQSDPTIDARASGQRSVPFICYFVYDFSVTNPAKDSGISFQTSSGLIDLVF